MASENLNLDENASYNLDHGTFVMKSVIFSALANSAKKLWPMRKFSVRKEFRAVRKIRAQSHFLRELRQRLAARFEGSRCLVIGSAPGVTVPTLVPGDCCICVNGSPYVANRCGITSPELTVISGLTTALRSEKSRATIPLMSGLHTDEIIFVETVDSEKHARAVLDEVGFLYDRFTRISTLERAAIVGEVCGTELGLGGRHDKISNGVFAAVIAAWACASEIVMCGFSLKGGHSYLEGDTPRMNLDGDVAFFAIAKDLGIGLTTTSIEIHDGCGIPIATSN